jgi:hypothetical protein
MKQFSFDEARFKAKVKPHIERCRDGDWGHAKRVVKWVIVLGEGSLYLFMIAGYNYDIGWRDVLPPQKLSFDKLLEYEGKANENSKSYISELLEDLDYTKTEIDFVLRLVRAADAHKSEDEDEAIVVDADNLSKLDINHVKEKYLPEDWMKMYELWRDEFPQRMQTELGKEKYPPLLKKLKDDIETNLEN